MTSIEAAIRFGLLLRPRNTRDSSDMISMIHAIYVSFCGLFILLFQIIQHLQDLKGMNEWEIFLQSSNPWSINAIFFMSAIYYAYDIFAMYKTHILNDGSSTMNDMLSPVKWLTSQQFRFTGFAIHHILCIIAGLIVIYVGVCGRIALFIFILGEFPNISRLMHTIICRRDGHQIQFREMLDKLYFVFKGSFIICRLGMFHFWWQIGCVLVPYSLGIIGWTLIVFGIIAVVFEWRNMQWKTYGEKHYQRNASQ